MCGDEDKYLFLCDQKSAYDIRLCLVGSAMYIRARSRIAQRQVPKPRCLSTAVNSLKSRSARRQVPKPRCLSPAVNSLKSRMALRQVPKPRIVLYTQLTLPTNKELDIFLTFVLI